MTIFEFSVCGVLRQKKPNLDFWHYIFNIISWGFLCCLYIKVQIHEMFINQIICTTMRTWWLNWHSRIQNKMELSSKNKNKRKIISQKDIFNKVVDLQDNWRVIKVHQIITLSSCFLIIWNKRYCVIIWIQIVWK